MITFAVEDYVVVEQNNKKHILCVDKATPGKSGRGVKQDKFPYEEDSLNFDADEVVANLGKKPRNGQVYGIHFDPYFKSFTHSQVGEVHFFLRASKEVKQEIEKNLDKAYKVMDKHGLTGIFPLYVEVRPLKGKMLGHYKQAKKEEMLDIVCVRPSPDSPLITTLYHEFAHGLWRKSIHKRKVKASWIRDYKQFIQVRHLTSKQLKSLLQELLSSGQTLTEFKSASEEENQLVLREVASYVKKYHRLSVQELDLLLESGDTETVTQVWPHDNLSLSKIKENSISNYSLKNVEEYFCECMASYLSGTKLPSRTEALITKTIQSL